VYRNAADAARGPSVQRPEITVWTSEEAQQFVSSAAANRLGAAFALLLTTGLRRGEVLGVRWSDLDLDAQTMSVVQTITEVDGKLVFGSPKTSKSERMISLDPSAALLLRQHRRFQREEQIALGPDWGNNRNLVFTDEVGAPIKPQWFSKEFRRVAAASGVPRIRLHDVRHTYATVALKAGIPAKVVSDHLGHSTIAITLDLYSHVSLGMDRDATDLLNSMWFGK
jgi:integrase